VKELTKQINIYEQDAVALAFREDIFPNE